MTSLDTSGSDQRCPHSLSECDRDYLTVQAVRYPGKHIVPEKKKIQKGLLPLLPFRMQELTVQCRISILHYIAYLAVQALVNASWESLQSWRSVSQDSAAFHAVVFWIKLEKKAYPTFSASGR